MLRVARLLVLVAIPTVLGECNVSLAGWQRHVIDDSSRGADGVKAADINGDGHLDLVTGWEEGGQIRVCLQPDVELISDRWPAVTVGRVGSPEDAVFCDLDRDGVFEVISCCEGSTRLMYVHCCVDTAAMLDEASWETNEIALDISARQWMFATPLETVASESRRIIAGAKGDGAELGILTSTGVLDGDFSWEWEPLRSAGWIMSIDTLDMDGDGDRDIIYSDRRGLNRGVYWMEQIGDEHWHHHTIGGVNHEVMFLDTGDLNGDGILEIVAAARDAGIIIMSRDAADSEQWQERIISLTETCGTGKGVAILDVDRDGDNDIVFSCENSALKIGVGWLAAPNWELQDISGSTEGVKFDLLLPMDVNADGWTDIITCEERENLGLIWYENPGN